MTKTLLSFLIALVFFFGAAGVTVAAAQQSQPGEALYAVRTWSAQMFRQQDNMQISGRVEQTTWTQSKIHEPEITQTPQSPAPFDVCDQSGTNGQCGSDQDKGADHVNDHPYQDHGDDGTNHQNNGTDHQNDGTDHPNGETHQQDGGSNHENNGSEHQENDH